MNDHHNIAAEQRDEGRRRTLGVRPGHNRPPRPKQPFVAKGHDAILKSVQDAGGMLKISRLFEDSTVTGKLIARDRYTLTLEVDGVPKTFYKHALEGFEPVSQVQ